MSRTHAVTIDPAQCSGRAFGRLTAIGAALAVLGLGVSTSLGGGTAQFYFSWLVAYMYFLGIALGALFFVLMLTVTRAAWGVSLRRIVENIIATLPMFALLFIPI